MKKNNYEWSINKDLPSDSEGNIYLELDFTHPCSRVGTQTYDGYIGATKESLQNANFLKIGRAHV